MTTNRTLFLYLVAWLIAWYILLMVSTMLTAELVVLSSIVLGIVNALIQERLLSPFFSAKSGGKVKEYSFLALISALPIPVYMVAIASFPAICGMDGAGLPLLLNGVLDFCTNKNLQTQGVMFLMALACVTTLLFGMGRILERNKSR